MKNFFQKSVLFSMDFLLTLQNFQIVMERRLSESAMW